MEKSGCPMAHKWDIQKRYADALEEHHFQAVCPEAPPFRSAVRGDSLIMTARPVTPRSWMEPKGSRQKKDNRAR
jgi:hypothetical protein